MKPPVLGLGLSLLALSTLAFADKKAGEIGTNIQLPNVGVGVGATMQTPNIGAGQLDVIQAQSAAGLPTTPGVQSQAEIPFSGAAAVGLEQAQQPQAGVAEFGAERAAQAEAATRGVTGGLDSEIRKASVPEADPSAVGEAIQKKYENTGKRDTLRADPQFTAVAGRHPALAEKVHNLVETGSQESARPNNQTLGFYQSAVKYVSDELKAGRVEAQEAKEMTASVIREARVYAATREERQVDGEKRDTPGALQALASSVEPGNTQAVAKFAKQASDWAQFLGVPLSNLEDVKEVLSRKSDNRVRHRIPFYDRGSSFEAKLEPTTQEKNSGVPAVDSGLAKRMKLGEPASEGALASGSPVAMPKEWWLRPAAKYRKHREGGARFPSIPTAQYVARSVTHWALDSVSSAVAAVYGMIRPAHLTVAGGAELISSDRGLLRLATLKPRSVGDALELDFGGLSPAELHATVTGEKDAPMIEASPLTPVERADRRRLMTEKAFAKIDRLLLSATPGRFIAYRAGGQTRIAARSVSSEESALLQALLGFEAQSSGGLWVASVARVSPADLATALSVLGGKSVLEAIDPAVVARIFAKAESEPSLKIPPDFDSRKLVGTYESKSGQLYDVMRTPLAWVFSNHQTGQPRLATQAR